ncbi:MAG: glycosyltransferase [Flavobacteriales bacterium]|jgi:glycosyltransferase involved in cell wall biosynthesis|nr:MAG: glycosyltransferase [Flavobacteriales bacterium]
MTQAADRPPLVTVLLPVHNASAYLQRTIDSISAQTLADHEVIAIDDGSTDGSAAILQAHAGPRFRIIRHAANQGLVASLNEGLAEARGRYIARMDADDLMHPERLERQAAWMDGHPEVAVLATCVGLINADGEPCGTWDTDQRAVTEADIADLLPRTNCIAHPTVMLRRDALGGLRYEDRQRGAEDWDLWLRLMARGARIAKLPEQLVQYRVHASSVMAESKREVPLEIRLMTVRQRFLTGELSRGRFGRVHAAVAAAQVRTLGRYLIHRTIRPLARDAYRMLTYSPWKLLRERAAIKKALSDWQGRHLLLFPYLHTGGAEQVHADILGTIADQRPLCLITGFSRDRSFLPRFAASAPVIEVPRLVNHPCTRTAARRWIARALDSRTDAHLFASNCAQFFELLPELSPHVRTAYLQHAFLYQPKGNAQHRAWLRHFPRVHRYVFIAEHARSQYRSFLLAHHMTSAQFGKLQLITNRVHRFAPPLQHTWPVRLLFVGRDSPEKRPELFQRIIERLHAEAKGRFMATAVGIRARECAAPIAFEGEVTDPARLADLYAAHDIIVVTSSREGFPLVVQEAMAHGLAVAAAPVGDIPIRLDGQCAIIAGSAEAATTEQDLVAGLKALELDRDRLWAMRQAAFTKARLEYDGAPFQAAYRELFGCTKGNA